MSDDDIVLPPLPLPNTIIDKWDLRIDSYHDKHMEEFARAAVLADRARRVDVEPVADDVREAVDQLRGFVWGYWFNRQWAQDYLDTLERAALYRASVAVDARPAVEAFLVARYGDLAEREDRDDYEVFGTAKLRTLLLEFSALSRAQPEQGKS